MILPFKYLNKHLNIATIGSIYACALTTFNNCTTEISVWGSFYLTTEVYSSASDSACFMVTGKNQFLQGHNSSELFGKPLVNVLTY